MKPKLLIIDDDEDIRTQMRWALGCEYEVFMAGDRAEALEVFASERPPVVMLDLGLPPQPNGPEEGMGVLAALVAADCFVKIVIISGQEEKENALQAIGSGAYDFLCKPVNMEEARLILTRCIYVAGLEREYRKSQESRQLNTFEGMLGTSAVMQSVFATITKVASTTAPVLLLGNSGTGKEMAARAVHSRSRCNEGPFVAINCNAIPESLMESELFGHEKGAFTGANSMRKGLIESASGGTLFLDEIGELPATIQVKLLRFLQERTFQRVGGRQEIVSDVRIVAATNANLKEMVKVGTFREDLYFRLAVVSVLLPPLSERGDDVLIVAGDFLQRFAAQNGRRGLMFAPDTLQAMLRHPWHGNIRELQNRVQRAVIMAESKRISVRDMELEDPGDAPAQITLKLARERLEKEMIQEALRKNQGKLAAAASDLGISRPTLYELIGKLGITRGDFAG